ncbi:MAG: N-acetyltransferase [Candidatus Eisenbacteria bacterium]|uniref:N-acetyltransferase n=1 Tax=Eiseniibacteriota bacterium TaxID=2212470 RepID=A0A956M2C8_UNCEI|nr:N-acetyltransferase [Candidatus Eisenbacteria bacterium]
MPLPSVQVTPVQGARELDEFIKFAWRVYRGDRNWVPPLISDLRKMLDRSKHPFHQHGEVEYFLARLREDGPLGRAGAVVGRIAAIVNHLHNEVHEEKTGFFGFYEVLPDPMISAALFEAASAWLAEKGMDRMRGPASFSTNEECGLLVDGFDSPPMVMMTYNPRYYIEHLESHGFTKAMDLLAYYLDDRVPPDRVLKLAERLTKRTKIAIRFLEKKNFGREVELVRDLYNRAWQKNWGFVPMTDAEIDHMAASLKPVLDPRLILFAELDGKPIGFALALPDVNQALAKANGRLFPFGLLRILIESRRIHRVRVLTLGIVEEHRGLGADLLMYAMLYSDGVRRGYHAGEFSWILEDNELMRRPLEALGATVYKTYRVYDRSIVR